MLAVHSGEQTDITTAANSSCCFYLLSLCWHRLAETQRACNCPSPPLWPQESVRSYKKLSFFKLCFHWRQRQGQPCSEDGEGLSQPEMLEGEENREGQGQNLLQFKEQCRRDHRGFQVWYRIKLPPAYCLLCLVSQPTRWLAYKPPKRLSWCKTQTWYLRLIDHPTLCLVKWRQVEGLRGVYKLAALAELVLNLSFTPWYE